MEEKGDSTAVRQSRKRRQGNEEYKRGRIRGDEGTHTIVPQPRLITNGIKCHRDIFDIKCTYVVNLQLPHRILLISTFVAEDSVHFCAVAAVT